MYTFSTKTLDEVYEIQSPMHFSWELERYCLEKLHNAKEHLSDTEGKFLAMAKIGGEIAAGGFYSLFYEVFTPAKFAAICDALAEEPEGAHLRGLLLEARAVFTRSSRPETVEEYDKFITTPPDELNSKQLMTRFDEIGDEIVTEIERLGRVGNPHLVNYAHRHRTEFTPITK